MKKFGFTLAELLVSLTVIAIAATLTATIAGNLMPDKNKVKVLKFHSAISNALESMFNNENLYHPGQVIVNGSVVTSCEGVECFYGNSGFVDFRDLLFERVPQNFMGGTWSIVVVAVGGVDNYTITFDTKPDEAGCVFGSVNCSPQDIDTFSFRLDQYGQLTPIDNLTRAYLENPLNLKSRKEDLAKANDLSGQGARSGSETETETPTNPDDETEDTETTEQTSGDGDEKKTETTELTGGNDTDKKNKDTEQTSGDSSGNKTPGNIISQKG